MVSVIVPVYNVESYLCQCIDSILNQTYTDFELLLIDDGSTDGSRVIADSYKDSRIHVFHTNNCGLSAARNKGIKESSGEYILFIDSDDWIDSDLLMQTIHQIEDADILSFGYYEETTSSIPNSFKSGLYNGHLALLAHLNGDISSVAWNKLYRRRCFASILFPEGRICEDVATTYKLLLQSRKVKCIEYCGYHHRFREGSLSNVHNVNNLTDYWYAVRDRFFDCKDIVKGTALLNLYKSCIWAIMRAWAWRSAVHEMKKNPAFYKELSSFTKKQITSDIRKRLPFKMKIGVFFARHNIPLSFWLAHTIISITRLSQGKNMD